MKKPVERLFILILLFSFFIQAEYYLELWIYDEINSFSTSEVVFSYLIYVLYSFLHFSIIFWIDILIIRRIESKFPWDEYFLSRIGLEFFSTQLCAVAVTVPLTIYVNYGLIKPFLNIPSDGLMISVYYNVVYILAINLLFVVMYEGVFLFGEKKQIQIEKEREQRQKIMSQFQALKNQVNPHFLLNTMGALEPLIKEQPASAVKFTRAFTYVYKNILELEDEPLISLGKELEFVKAYFYLQQMRFGEFLTCEIALLDDQMNRMLPPFALQLLVENAIKHNEISKDKPLTIRITEKEGKIIITNPLQPTSRQEESTKKGISNLQKRYEILGLEAPKFVEQENHFKVEICLA